MSILLSDAAPPPSPPQPNLSFYILFSCERMELSQYVTDFGFSGQARCFPWPLDFKSVEMKQGFFSHIYKWALFMYSLGTACFLKGFMRIWLYIQWGETDLCRVVTYSIILRMIWNGWPPWNWTVVAGCSRVVCQSAGDERSQRIASRFL